MRKRRVWWLLAAIAAIVYFYPVGGVIWKASQVQGLAMGRGEQRRVLQGYNGMGSIADEALTSARTDRFRRFIPGRRCSPMDLQFRTADRWVDVHLSCADGFMFDNISRDRWQ